MPLSEHEQRMLDEIENALYEEDPKFASHVRGRRFATPTAKRRLQALFIALCGLALLIVGLATGALHLGGVPVLSIIGFIVMFLGGVMIMLGTPWGRKDAQPSAAPRGGKGGTAGSGGRGAGRFTRGKGHGGAGKGRGGFTDRMEDRFRKRFE